MQQLREIYHKKQYRILIWQTTETLDWFLSQQTEDVSRTMGSRNLKTRRIISTVYRNTSWQTTQNHDLFIRQQAEGVTRNSWSTFKTQE